jgi:aryl-alcohol dehydrogenase-like predicted oxidoreductase
MRYRPFGRTGLSVSEIGFGSWEMGGTYGAFEDQAMIEAVHAALDAGINCYDTAEVYGFGQSERLLGRALGARRKDVIVVSKFGVGYRNEGRTAGRDGRAERVRVSIEKTLQALGTDYLDVYLIHWPDRETPFEETMAALEELVKAGKTRFVGVSNFKAEEIVRCDTARRVDVGQYGYHMFDRRMERDVLPCCHARDIGVMGYGPLAHGLLAGAFTKETKFAENDWRARGGAFRMPLFTPENFPRNLALVEDLKALAAKRGATLPQLAIAWVLSNPAVDVALVGARSAEEVRANLGAMDVVVDDALRRDIDAIFTRHGVETRPDTWVD